MHSGTMSSTKGVRRKENDSSVLENLVSQTPEWLLVALVVAVSVAFRFAVGLHGYSGFQTPPMHGDFEAQRHWQEITVNLNVTDWYRQTAANDLRYWGLDYPPLTAYHSWLCGKIAQLIEPASVELYSSRGYESPSHKLFMRLTVIAGDLLIYFPSVWYLVSVFYRNEPRYKRLIAMLFLTLHPALLLVDHGHFQYNSISIGFAFFAIAFILDGYDLIGSAFFCFSLNYKQMSLFYAPAFFFYLLAKNFRLSNFFQSVFKIGSIGLIVVATFSFCWRPFLLLEQASIVLGRLFPIGRGLFEDKVANFWCSVSPVLRMKDYFDVPTLVKICTISTLSAMSPAAISTLRRPTAQNFLWALTSTSFSFFLFGFQVHEKSVLLPVLVFSVLIWKQPGLVVWTSIVSCFSMFPLLVRDGVGIAYFGVLLGFTAVCSHTFSLQAKWLILGALPMAALHVVSVLVPPPARYPDLHPLLMVAYSFVTFAAVWLWSIYQLAVSPSNVAAIDQDKKNQ